MVATLEQGPDIAVPLEKATMKSRMSSPMRITFEIIAFVFGVLLASWSGPTVHDYIAPKFKIICPICNWGPNEPRGLK